MQGLTSSNAVRAWGDGLNLGQDGANPMLVSLLHGSAGRSVILGCVGQSFQWELEFPALSPVDGLGSSE